MRVVGAAGSDPRGQSISISPGAPGELCLASDALGAPGDRSGGGGAVQALDDLDDGGAVADNGGVDSGGAPRQVGREEPVASAPTGGRAAPSAGGGSPSGGGGGSSGGGVVSALNGAGGGAPDVVVADLGGRSAGEPQPGTVVDRVVNPPVSDKKGAAPVAAAGGSEKPVVDNEVADKKPAAAGDAESAIPAAEENEAAVGQEPPRRLISLRHRRQRCRQLGRRRMPASGRRMSRSNRVRVRSVAARPVRDIRGDCRWMTTMVGSAVR